MHRSRSALLTLLLSAGCQDAPADEPASDTELDSESGESSGDPEEDASSSGGDDGESSSSDTGGVVEGPIEGRPCLPDATATADNFGMPFLLTWCAGCHSSELGADERAGAPLDVDLDTLDSAREHLLRIYARSADDNLTMPPAGGPTDEERALLGDWLACGAPE